MAAFFPSFRSSSMPKRLLRYALSRLELLDAEALDMDNLDLAIGRTSVLEFRDVGIKLQKLQGVLKLAPAFTLQKAKVLKLRVTIPVDFYTSPITVEVEGVDVRLKIDTRRDEDETARNSGQATRQQGPDVVPTAADLAQSFLETQPLAEKKQLEDALSAETRDLGASLSLSEHDNDGEGTFGTGQGLSLPGFLTDFLQGIVNRTQVSIGGVTFQLDVDVPVDAGAPAGEMVTFQIALDAINVEGITTLSDVEEEAPKAMHKEGMRHVSLRNIRAFLISEAAVFSTFARSPSMQSSRASQSPVLNQRQSFSRESTNLVGNLDPSIVSDPEELVGNRYPTQDSEDAFNIPYDLTGEGNDEDDANSPDSTPRASLYSGSSGGPRSSPRSGSPRPDMPRQESFPWNSGSPALRPGSPIPDYDPTEDDIEDSFHSSAGRASPYRPVPEDLTQSHLFSHEEAESMYMSAFSQTESVQLRNVMPGAWDSSSPIPSPKRRRTSPAQDPVLEVAPQRVEPSARELPPQKSATPQPDITGVQVPQIPAESYAKEAEVAQTAEEEALEDETQQDDVATPRGPTRLVKEILSVKSISIYVPLNDKPPQVSTPEQHRPNSPRMAGAFSVHAASEASVHVPEPFSAPPSTPPDSANDRSLEVHLAPLEVRFDASLGSLLATVVSKLLEALKSEDATSPRGDSAPATTSSPLPSLAVAADKISLVFLEKLPGVADTAERIFADEQLDPRAEVLLRMDLLNLTAKHARSDDAVHTDITLETFRFGYADDSIISFDDRFRMRESVMDEIPTGGADVSIKLKTSSKTTRAEVRTLPLHVKLDLQRLDETFTWFGGLSGFLLMSSSMTSSAAPRTAVSPTKTVPRARGVHFRGEALMERPLSASESKIYTRIGGFRLDLVGKDCSIAVDTSAMKLASNDDLLGIHLSKIRLAGPYLRNSRASPPIVVNFDDTRLDYFALPKDNDLERLLELITPSKVKFDDDDDEIMVDTLLRQRRKGPVLRAKVDKISVAVGNLPVLGHLPSLGEELARLATVAKYLPEDDRPGLLTLGSVNTADFSVEVAGRFGVVTSCLQNLEVAHITVPSLLALRLQALTAHRNQAEELIGSPGDSEGGLARHPVVMMRMIGESIEPAIKIKLMGLRIEYRVPTIMDVLGLAEDATPQDFEASLAASVANLGEQAQTAIAGKRGSLKPETSTPRPDVAEPTTVDLGFRDCIFGLNPLGLTSKLVIVLTDAHLRAVLPREGDIQADGRIAKSSILLINDVSLLDSKEGQARARRRPSDASSKQVAELCSLGYVDICHVSSAQVVIKVVSTADAEKQVDIALRNDLLVLETCADSTQTLITLANALKPPTPPSKEIKYRTEVVPVENLLASLSADAFGKAEGDYDFDNDFAMAQELGGDGEEEEEVYVEGNSSPLDIDSQYYEEEEARVEEELFDAESSSLMSGPATAGGDDAGRVSIQKVGSTDVSQDDEPLVIEEDFFGQPSLTDGTAHRWNSAKNIYDRSNDDKVQHSPLRVSVRDVHVIWNLFDGYDWNRTREVITQAVRDVEDKAYERRARRDRRSGHEQDYDDNETVVGDFLFNSIWVAIPANRDPGELAHAINQELNDNGTETETQSVATTSLTAAATPSRAGGSLRSRSRKKLRLSRSRHHKITFELKGVNMDLIVFPSASGETQSSIDVRIRDLDIFDHVPTSTWKKFAMYDEDAGEREMGTSMVHLEILTVKPVPELAASEIVLKATVLPLRLHVDQDALDFITRFFEFKDDSVPVHASPSDVPFVQRAEVNSVPVKLDFKPKRVDYAGLRSGHTTEFMNFLILEDSRMVLRHTIIYGVSGFDRLGETLNDIWMPDIKRTQLPGVLAGLASVRSLVNVGAGVKDLVVIPLREYRRDGRIARSLGRGAAAFAKTTGTELVKLGAKLAVGTQYALQGAEGMLVGDNNSSSNSPHAGGASGMAAGAWQDLDDDGDDDGDDQDGAHHHQQQQQKHISLYADQPMGILSGLRGAYASIRRDLRAAGDAIIAVPGEVMESSSAQGAARAVLRRAPTIVLRPAIGASRAIGQTLMGATNTLDPENRRRMEAKYKKH